MKRTMNYALIMKIVIRLAAGLAIVAAAILVGALVLISFAPSRALKPQDVFGFKHLAERAKPNDIPAPLFYRARDGEQLAYRFYDSKSDLILIFVHGSDYHGGGYDYLARSLSSKGFAKVYLPNLRGHYLSGSTRGDVKYLGQLEDDIADLIAMIRAKGETGPIILGGHSSGGGFAIRFAGGKHGRLAAGYLLLTPVLLPPAPTYRSTPTVKAATSANQTAGWATTDVPRIIGLTILNAFGITWFNGLPIVWFNKPKEYLDGTETLVYSYRLDLSMHPRFNYGRDIAAMGDNVLLMVGADDEQNYPDAYAPLFARFDPKAKVIVLPRVNHMGIIDNAEMLDLAGQWLSKVADARATHSP
ncbi:MAG: alpha/beta fold hydrolase [Candidatus Binataceae bacterium]